MSNRLTKEHLYHYILLNVLAKQHLKDVRYYRPYERHVGKTFVEGMKGENFKGFLLRLTF